MQQDNQKNLLLAIVLSVAVLLGWQVFYAGPKLKEEQDRRIRQQQAQQPPAKDQPVAPKAGPVTAPTPGVPGTAPQPAVPGTAPAAPAPTRAAALRTSPRVAIETPSLTGSIALKGGRVDDVLLVKYRETVDPKSPNVVLFSPSGAPHPFYAEHGWATGSPGQPMPDSETEWRAEKQGPLTPTSPVTLVWDNGKGLLFRRTIAVDADYLFTVTDEVENKTRAEISLNPYGLISRHGTPKVEGFYILHEGLIGVLGDAGLQEMTYADAIKDGGSKTFKQTGGWLGITDKYWAAALIPDQKVAYEAHLGGSKAGGRETFQTDYLLGPIAVPPGGKAQAISSLFAGAKQMTIIESYQEKLGARLFDRLIDWGWFWFITKPLFKLLHWLSQALGNYGLAVLATTVLVKAAFFPLASKSYESMAKMKKLQPEMEKIRDRYKEDRGRQQQELMALYKNEKINPMSGCLPILLQIPVFFALYKVLFVTIDMRHAPFFGWIRDLSAPDPTSIFNLFGLLPYAVPEFLHVGAWPLIMGMTMWVQMQLNPQQPDPMQQKIFNWMPVMFTFLLASFPAGLVIYWAWNNVLSLLQQYYIMRKNGAEIHLWKNIGIEDWQKKRAAGESVSAGELVGKAGASAKRGVEQAVVRIGDLAKRIGKPSVGPAPAAEPEPERRQAIPTDGHAGAQVVEETPSERMTRAEALKALDLEPDATAFEIDAAFKRKSKGQHAGLNGSSRLTQARETLRGTEGS